MNFTVPLSNDKEMVLYIWKIIGYPYISLNELVFKISFELFLFSPEEAQEFIDRSIDKGFIIVDDKNRMVLSPKLKMTLENWHKKREIEILKKISSKQQYTKILDNSNSNKFNILLKGLLDKGTLNRAASISESAFDLKQFNSKSGVIKAEVSGSQEIPYIIDIQLKEKILLHNCHDFKTNRAKNKSFCKHLVKLFLILKEKDEVLATEFLEAITGEINKWEFNS